MTCKVTLIVYIAMTTMKMIQCEDMLEVKKCMLYFLLNNGGYDMRLCIVVWILKKTLFLHLQQEYFLCKYLSSCTDHATSNNRGLGKFVRNSRNCSWQVTL